MDNSLLLSLVMRSSGASMNTAKAYLPYFEKYFKDYGITSDQRLLAFFSQVGKESHGFARTVEDLDGYASTKRILEVFGPGHGGRIKDEEEALMGLTDPVWFGNKVYGGRFGTPLDEGYLYRGRGLIHITFKDEYKRITEVLRAQGHDVDLEKHPELLEDPKWATLASLEWWKAKGMNKLADKLDLSKPLDKEPNLAIIRKLTSKVTGASETKLKNLKKGAKHDHGFAERKRLLKNGADKVKEMRDKGQMYLLPLLQQIDLNLRQLRSNLKLA